MTHPHLDYPAAYQGWRPLAVAAGTLTDANGTLVSLTDNGDGSWTAVLDDAYATTDPKAGAVIAFRMVDPTGVALDEFKSMDYAVVVTGTLPADESDVAVVAGAANSAALDDEYFYGGVDFADASGPSRAYGDGGSWTTAGASASTTGAFGSMSAKRYATNDVSCPHTGRVSSLTSSGAGNGEAAVTPASTKEWSATYFFVSIMRTAISGGAATITFWPSYSVGMNGTIPGVS